MARGKQTCKILKEIRRQIAEANDIEFVTSECRYKGDCLGTCPKCEAEVRYLEQQLYARSLAGKAVALAGVSAGMFLMAGCNGTSNQSDRTTHDKPVEQTETKDTIGFEEVVDSSLIRNSASSTPLEPIVKKGEVPAIPEDLFVGEVERGEIGLGSSPEKTDERDIYVYAVVDQKPQFPGGDAALNRFINEHLKYPEELLSERIQGRVVVKFYIDSLGYVCEPEILRSKGPALDREALRVVRLLPRFNPGKRNGKRVNTYYNLPVTFKLPADTLFSE